MKQFGDIDTYLEAQPTDARQALERIRKIVKQVVPKAEEVISYGMPAIKYHGILLYFAAFKNHCSLFPAEGKIIEQFKEELKGYITSKGTIQFTTDKPLPASLIKMIVKERKLQNEKRAVNSK